MSTSTVRQMVGYKKASVMGWVFVSVHRRRHRRTQPEGLNR